jgi:hypothetical protein
MVKFVFAGSFGVALYRYRLLYVRKINLLMTASGEKVVLVSV